MEIYLEGKWQLFDSINGKLYENYDYNNLSLPSNYYAFSKSLNGFFVGIVSPKTNDDIMKRKFHNFDLAKYQDPNYEAIELNKQNIETNDFNSRLK